MTIEDVNGAKIGAEIHDKGKEIVSAVSTNPDHEEIQETEAENKVTDNVCGTPSGKSDNDSGSSPRRVLEPQISSSDSDQSSIDSSSSFGGENSPVESLNIWDLYYRGMRWKKMITRLKRKSSTRIATIGLDLSIKSLKRRLGMYSPEETTDAAVLIMPKPSWRNFTIEELKKATDNFKSDYLIGKGGHAEVFRGFLPDGQLVAVKKIMKDQLTDEDAVCGFLAELGIIAHIDHPNSAKLIGFSIDDGLYLVLQFCAHGSLASVLHDSTQSLEWGTRYKLATGIAEGLKYLHCNCQKRIVHRDITASNILLTEDYEPQISDFGLAKWLPENCAHHIASPIEGTFGYMAPEYFMHGIITEKVDVFAFGVLLLELITGRRSVDASQQSLVMWAKPLLEKNNIKEIADHRLGDNYDITEMKRAMFAASICVHHVPNMRPTMNRVVQVLNGEKEISGSVKQKSMGMKALLWECSDVEGYNSTTYLEDLNRHKELVME